MLTEENELKKNKKTSNIRYYAKVQGDCVFVYWAVSALYNAFEITKEEYEFIQENPWIKDFT